MKFSSYGIVVANFFLLYVCVLARSTLAAGMGDSRLTHAILSCEPLLGLDESHAVPEIDDKQRSMQTCAYASLSKCMQANESNMHIKLASTDERREADAYGAHSAAEEKV